MTFYNGFSNVIIVGDKDILCFLRQLRRPDIISPIYYDRYPKI